MRTLILNCSPNGNREPVICLIGASSKTRQVGTTKWANLSGKEMKKGKTSTGWSSSQQGERVDDRRDQRNGGRAGAMKMEMKKRGQWRTGLQMMLTWEG